MLIDLCLASVSCFVEGSGLTGLFGVVCCADSNCFGFVGCTLWYTCNRGVGGCCFYCVFVYWFTLGIVSLVCGGY